MWQIQQKFDDFTHPSKKGWIYLNADKPIIPTHILSYPINWVGTINGQKITIVQKGSITLTIDDFEFIDLPEKYSFLKEYIVGWIDDYLRILD